MKRKRIVEMNDGYNTYYIIQRKILGFWCTYEDPTADVEDIPYELVTLEAAENYVKYLEKCEMVRRKAPKTFEYYVFVIFIGLFVIGITSLFINDLLK